MSSYKNIHLVWFNFAPKAAKSGRLIDISTAKAIAHTLPNRIIKVWIFLDNTLDEILDCVRQIPLDAIQIHDELTPEMIKEMRSSCPWVGIIKALHRQHIAEYINYQPFVDCFVFDSTEPGSGLIYDYTILNTIPVNIPFLIAGGITADNVSQVLKDIPHTCGIDVASGIESILPNWKKILDKNKAEYFAQQVFSFFW